MILSFTKSPQFTEQQYRDAKRRAEAVLLAERDNVASAANYRAVAEAGEMLRVVVGTSLVLSTLALLIAIASSPLVNWGL